MVYSFRPMEFTDLWTFNNVNVDRMTETYGTDFYSNYFLKESWSEYAVIARHGPTGVVCGYMLGKAEGENQDWHGHISAVTIAPAFRRTGLARRLMEGVERISAECHQAYFVDLFVRNSNVAAQKMYEQLGYIKYRTVLGYYSDGPPGATGAARQRGEDAMDLRKAMPRNNERAKSAVIPLTKPIQPHELEWH